MLSSWAGGLTFFAEFGYQKKVLLLVFLGVKFHQKNDFVLIMFSGGQVPPKNIVKKEFLILFLGAKSHQKNIRKTYVLIGFFLGFKKNNIFL